jgi:hypothetical protein
MGKKWSRKEKKKKKPEAKMVDNEMHKILKGGVGSERDNG